MKNFDQLRAIELNAFPRDRTVIFIPIGPIEDHGEALPMGLDLFEAEAVCRASALLLEKEGWTTLLFPKAALGVDSNTSAVALRVRPHVLRDYLVDICDSLAKAGFRYFVAVSGNPGTRQLTAIEEAGLFLRKRYKKFGFFKNANIPVLVSGSSIAIDPEEKSLSAIFMSPSEHGGSRDASVALAVVPEWVDAALLPSLEKTAMTGTTFERWRLWKKGGVRGYWGDPRHAEAKRGAESINEKSKTIVLKFRAGIESGKSHQIFKSWYSLFPSNQSLFRIWILVLLLAALLGGWTFYSLQGFLAGADFS